MRFLGVVFLKVLKLSSRNGKLIIKFVKLFFLLFKVPGWNFGRVCPFKKTAAKLQGLWNAQNMRTVTANQIKEAVGKKLKTPGVTRWNSYYDACVMILEVLEDPNRREKLNVVMHRQKMQTTFFDADKALLTQYCKIMKPVATCLDNLQGEEKAYMGVLLPTLKLLKDSLEALKADNSIVEGQELIKYLLEHPTKKDRAFKGRFQPLFENEALLMATALHPHFKLRVVRFLNMEKKEGIKQAILSEAVQKVTPTEVKRGGDTRQDMEDDPFMYMSDDEDVVTQCPLVEEMKKTFNDWNLIRGNRSISVAPDQFPMLNRAAWIDLFIKYNTPLPSSAAVERLFSMGSDILRAKRSSLTADNFEKLLFIRGNLQLLDEKSISAKLDMGDEDDEDEDYEDEDEDE
jgi:hypothetical protein